jgi:hypothetical protein
VDETKRRESRYEEAQHSQCENASADRPVECRIVGRRYDLTGAALQSVLKEATLKIDVSELREDNAKDKEERRYDWESEELLHLTRIRRKFSPISAFPEDWVPTKRKHGFLFI